MSTLAFFEDEGVHHLKPLTYLRPAYDLRAGILSLRHRIELDLGRYADFLLCRTEVKPLADRGKGKPSTVLPSERSEPTLFVNGRLLTASQSLVEEWRSLLEGRGRSPAEYRCWQAGNTTIAAWCPPSQTVALEGGLPQFDVTDSVAVRKIRLVERLWDLTSDIARYINDDASAMGVRGVSDEAIVSQDAMLAGGHFMAVGSGAVVEAGAVLLSEDGPIIVESNARIMAGAVVRGPCHVGEGSHVRMGARVSSSSFGRQCRVGGEVSNTVFFAFANKAHDGYVGNSYIGPWCNLGADTNTSNLRNDYGEVKLFNEHLGAYEPSGKQFLGLVMGDHSRSGINTMFNTGTVVGLVCNVFGAGFQPRHVPSFSWGGKERRMVNRPERALASIRAMMDRRGKDLTDEEERALLDVYEKDYGRDSSDGRS